jgi:hypothetical protein
MDIPVFTFKILLLFLPGIICAYIVNSIAFKDKFELSKFLIQSFVFGILSYFIFWIVLQIPFFKKKDVQFLSSLNSISQEIQYKYSEILWTCLISIFLAYFISFLIRKNCIFQIANFLRITERLGDDDVWSFYLGSTNVEWVTVRDHNNDLIYDGMLEAYSEGIERAELILSDVIVYKNSTGNKLYQDVKRMYLSLKNDEIAIECRSNNNNQGEK